MIGFYVNTFNRSELAQRSVISLRQCRAIQLAPIHIVDDGSTAPMWWHEKLADRTGLTVHTIGHCGPGLARKQAMEIFLRGDDEVGFFLDSDLLYAPAFDAKTINLLTLCTDRQWVSPYRSVNHVGGDRAHQGAELELIFGKTFGGATMVARRAAVSRLMDAMTDEDWRVDYDWRVCEKIDGVFKPVRSLVEHVGTNHPDSLHHGSVDHAYT